MMIHVPLCGLVHTNVSCWSMTLGHAYMMLCVLLCGHVHMMLHVSLCGLVHMMLYISLCGIVHANVSCWFLDGWEMLAENLSGIWPRGQQSNNLIL